MIDKWCQTMRFNELQSAVIKTNNVMITVSDNLLLRWKCNCYLENSVTVNVYFLVQCRIVLLLHPRHWSETYPCRISCCLFYLNYSQVQNIWTLFMTQPNMTRDDIEVIPMVVQDYSISSSFAMEILQSCTKPSICCWQIPTVAKTWTSLNGRDSTLFWNFIRWQ